MDPTRLQNVGLVTAVNIRTQFLDDWDNELPKPEMPNLKEPFLDGRRWTLNEIVHDDPDDPHRTFCLSEDEVLQRHSVYLLKCKNVRLFVPRAVAHIMIDTCENCFVEYYKTISCLEIVHSKHVRCRAVGSGSRTIQVDLCEDIVLDLGYSMKTTNIVHAGTFDLWAVPPRRSATELLFARPGRTTQSPGTARRINIPASMFGLDQRWTSWDADLKRFVTRSTEPLKKGGYVSFSVP